MPTYSGIDISAAQKGLIDWTRIQIDFAILRAGYGRYAKQKDAYFEEAYRACDAKGIPAGAYWYSYAKTPEEAMQEAAVCLEVIKGKKFAYPIFYDVEEKEQFDLGKEKVSAIIRAFLQTVEAAGYWVGLYGNLSSLNKWTADDIKKRYTIWLAQWDVQKPTYKGAYDIWQIKAGQLPGVSGAVDLDESYKDFPTLIKAKGLNGFTPEPEKHHIRIQLDGCTYEGDVVKV